MTVQAALIRAQLMLCTTDTKNKSGLTQVDLYVSLI